MARIAQNVTRKHFGKVMRLFAPIYLSNECVNICKYCGFSRNNPIPRTTLPVEKVSHEANLLAKQGISFPITGRWRTSEICLRQLRAAMHSKLSQKNTKSSCRNRAFGDR